MERIITKSFARLMGRGIHRGFITHEELNKSLGKRNLSGLNLEQAFIHILDEKITLVEKKSDYKVLRKKDNSSKEEGKSSEKNCLTRFFVRMSKSNGNNNNNNKKRNLFKYGYMALLILGYTSMSYHTYIRNFDWKDEASKTKTMQPQLRD